MAESFCRVGDDRALLRDLRRPRRPRRAARHGPGHADARLARGLLHATSPAAASTSSATTTATSGARRSSRAPRCRASARSSAATSAPPPTRLAEMAADGVGLLDHLGIERAHVVGVSMGGMIAQTIAARRPERVLSLTSIMSSTGSRWRGQPALRTYRQFLRPVSHRPRRPTSPRPRRCSTSSARPASSATATTCARSSAPCTTAATTPARSPASSPPSSPRATAPPSCATSPPRPSSSTAPSRPLVDPSGGRATARAIPGARLLMIEGMGHDLPRGAWPQLIDAIVENTRRAAAPATAGAAA